MRSRILPFGLRRTVRHPSPGFRELMSFVEGRWRRSSRSFPRIRTRPRDERSATKQPGRVADGGAGVRSVIDASVRDELGDDPGGEKACLVAALQELADGAAA